MFVDLLREADAPLNARSLQHRLVARGYDPAAANLAWRKAQPAVRRHPAVSYEPVQGAYHYHSSDTAAVTAEQALDVLVAGSGATHRVALAATIRAALRDRDDLEARLRTGYAGGRELRSAQERHIRIESVRALVDVVSEVEELCAAGVDLAVLTERVRALARAFGLEPVAQAGERTAFVSSRHTPIGSRPPDEERVIVIRPGYCWRWGDEVVLISKAQVAWSPHGAGRAE